MDQDEVQKLLAKAKTCRDRLKEIGDTLFDAVKPTEKEIDFVTDGLCEDGGVGTDACDFNVTLIETLLELRADGVI